MRNQIDELEKIEKAMKDSRKVVKDILAVGIPAEILFLKKKFLDRLKELHDQYSDYPRTPHENDILEFKPNTKFDLRGAIGTVTADPFPQQFTLNEAESMHFIQGNSARLTVTRRDIIGTTLPISTHEIKVKAKLRHSSTEDETMPRKIDEQDGMYTIELQPTSHGNHELSVTVSIGNDPDKEVGIKGSPFKVSVSRPLLDGIQAENPTIPGLQSPGCVAVKRGGATRQREGGQGVQGGEGQRVGEDGAAVVGARENGAGQNKGAQAVAGSGVGNAEQGDIIAITDTEAHRVAIITNGDFQNPRWVGKEGTGDLQFRSPRGVAFTHKGDIVVVDKENCRVQILWANGKFKGKFGTMGSNNGEFKRPSDVVIDANGTMYISDTENNRIQYFDTQWKFQGVIGGAGTFSDPYALTCDELGRIFITEKTATQFQCWVPRTPRHDYSSSEESASTQGGFKLSYKSKSLSEGLLGIAHHSVTNYIIVSERTQHRLSIFDKNGDHLASVGKQGEGNNDFKEPMGVAVMSDSRVIVCDCGKRKIMTFSIV